MTSISVAMCTFDGARFLDDQLASIAAQRRLPDELVVVDDGSTDGTFDRLAAFAATAPFDVHLHRNDRTLGSTKNFEGAIARCTGDVVVLSDQDDEWAPTWVATVASTFEHRPEAGLVFTDAELIDDRGQLLGRTLWEQLGVTPADLDVVRSPAAVDLLVEGATVAGATMAFRSAYRPLVLPIPDDLPLLHDAWIAVLLGAASTIVAVQEPLVRYRQHAGQQNGSRPRNQAGVDAGPALRQEGWERLLEVGERLLERLDEHRGEFVVDAAAARIAERMAHARFRSGLPTRRMTRATGAARELASGRYHRFSNGVRSAVKDVVGG